MHRLVPLALFRIRAAGPPPAQTPQQKQQHHRRRGRRHPPAFLLRGWRSRRGLKRGDHGRGFDRGGGRRAGSRPGASGLRDEGVLGGGLYRCPGSRPRLRRAPLQEIVQVPGQLLPALVAPVGVLGQGARDDVVVLRGKRRVQLAGRDGLLVDDLERHRRGGVAREGFLPGEQPVEDDPQREQVRAPIHRPPAQLLGAHIGGRAQDLPRLGQLGHGQLGDAEVGDLGPAFLGHHDVGGFDVAVDDLPAVGVVERCGHLLGQPQRLLGRQPLARLR